MALDPVMKGTCLATLRLIVLASLISFPAVYCLDRISHEHTIHRKSAHFDIQSAHKKWKLIGDAFVADGFVLLTRDERSQVGGIWSTQPVDFPEWEVEMEFHVPAKNSHLFGDGMVLWYVNSHNERGNVFGYKDYFKGLALFLDTYCNHNDPHEHNHPYLSLMVNDGSVHYDHDQDGTHTQAAGCEFPFRHITHSAFIRMRYQANRLTLHKRLGNEPYTECFSIDGVQLPTHYYFGVTAATGELSDEHRLLSFQVKNLNVEKISNENRRDITPRALTAEKQREHSEGKSRHHHGLRRYVKVFLVGLILLVAIGIGIWLISLGYYEQQRRSKRLY